MATKDKGSLSNSLIGRTVEPRYYEPGQVNVPMTGPWPQGFKANLAGEHRAEIVAAWTQDGQVMLAIVDPWGGTGQTYLVNVKVTREEVKG